MVMVIWLDEDAVCRIGSRESGVGSNKVLFDSRIVRSIVGAVCLLFYKRNAQ